MQLYTPIEIQQLQENEDLPYLNQILEWVKTFLGKPHPLLGRPGAVCPFVPHSIRTNSIRLAVIRSKDLYPEQIENLVKRYRDIFLEMDAKEQESRISKAFY